MTPLHSLPRLLWRPSMLLWLVFPLIPAVAYPLALLAESGVPLRALWEGGGGRPAQNAAWQLLVLLAAAAGLGVRLARLEAEQTPLFWTLPELRRGLFAGTLLLSLAIATGMAFLVSRNWEPGGAYAASFGLALFWFALASAMADSAFPLVARWSAALALLAAAFRPAALADLARAWPWLVGIGGVLAAAVLVLLQFSAPAARRRILSSFDRKAGPWVRSWQVDRDWVHSLATDRLSPWLRASAYEGSNGYPLGVTLAVGATIAVLWAHLSNDPGMALILAGIFLTNGRLVLSTALLHPISRRRRANLVTLGCAVHSALFVLLMAAMAVAVEALGVPDLGWFDEPPARHAWGLVLAMIFAWSPVVLWGPVRWPASVAEGSHSGMFKAFLLLIPFGVGANFSSRALAGQGPLEMALAAAGIAVLVWLAFAWTVSRHYAGADLVPRVA